MDSVIQPGAPTPPYLPDQLPGVITLGERMGSGGYADVHVAFWDLGDGGETVVCVKRIRPTNISHTNNLTAEERFEIRIRREVCIWANANHENIMPFIGYQMEGRLEVRLVSPWEENGNLWSYIRDNEVDEIQRLRFLQQSARGLAYLHGLTPPIAHGDMKTDNIIVRSDLTAALSDFGISRIILDLDNPTGLTTATMGPAGTLRFQAPEILSGGLPSPSSDIYAMAGVILHVMSGEKPYGAMRNKHAIMLEILKGVVPKPQDHAQLPEADPLWPFLRRCWDQTTGMRPVALDVVDEVGNGIDRRTIPDHAQMPE